MAQKLLNSLLLLFVTGKILAQGCSTLGQTPSTAFPVCGASVIFQSSVPLCRNYNLFVPGCTDSRTEYGDNNPFYYKFTCFTAGTLGFVITPVNPVDNYDWQLYDITGHNPNDITTDKSLVVTGNWSGSFGPTGASATGVNYIQCRSDPFFVQTPTFSTMPVIQAQHEYLLLVGHYDTLQSGYSLSFGGGTASITNPLVPALTTAKSNCNSNEIAIKLNKKIKCSSIAPDGSDFSLSPPVANPVSAAGINCNSSFDTDSLLVILDNSIPPGNYSLVAKSGTDGNTLSDYCDNPVNAGSQAPFIVLASTPMDSLAPVGCLPDKLTLVFKKNIQCGSIAPDGSDFVITGTTPVTIINASGVCNSNNSTTSIEISLSQRIINAGNYTITLTTGSDGNPIIDECGTAIPVGSAVSFIIKDTVNADFSFNIHEGCTNDTVTFFNEGRIGVNSWNWSFDNSQSSLLQNPAIIYSASGPKQVQLIVSNGMCRDTTISSFVLNEKLKADFTGPGIVCPEDAVIFKDNSANVTEWFWDFSNGNTSILQNPPPQNYPTTNSGKEYLIYLTVGDGKCVNTTSHILKVVKTCYVAVPSAFTPNNDGLNDFLYPLNAFKADNLKFKVYNRLGQKIFETTDWKIKWDGTFNGIKQPTGTYVWFLNYTHRDTGQKIFQKGTTLLIR